MTTHLCVAAWLAVMVAHAPQACARGADGAPAALAWAYPQAAAASQSGPPPGVYRAPGSVVTLSVAQITDELNPPDWYPRSHPAAPDVVAHGKAGGPKPCATCHLFNGAGFLGVPDLAGLPAGYIVEQVRLFRAGARRPAVQDWPPAGEMAGIARSFDDTQIAEAAAYYARLPRVARFRVVEAARVPATRPDHDGWRDLVPDGGTEPIGGRIIEVAEDTRRMMWLSDPHSGVVDYVPQGAIARGAALARGGGASGLACAGCHGAELRGAGGVPPIAGRSAAYLARAMWDIRAGARGGPGAARMRPVAAGLGADQVRDLAAYLASLMP